MDESSSYKRLVKVGDISCMHISSISFLHDCNPSFPINDQHLISPSNFNLIIMQNSGQEKRATKAIR